MMISMLSRRASWVSSRRQGGSCLGNPASEIPAARLSPHHTCCDIANSIPRVTRLPRLGAKDRLWGRGYSITALLAKTRLLFIFFPNSLRYSNRALDRSLASKPWTQNLQMQRLAVASKPIVVFFAVWTGCRYLLCIGHFLSRMFGPAQCLVLYICTYCRCLQ